MAIAGLVLGYVGVAAIPVMIVAAIAIPNLIRARIAANEASAVASLRTIHAAAIVYSQRYSNSFPRTFSSMDRTGTSKANCDHAELLDWPLVSGQKDGYVFEYIPPDDPGVPSWSAARAAAKGCTFPGVPSFSVHANPVSRGTTGQRSFFIDETGVIRYEIHGLATVHSPPLR